MTTPTREELLNNISQVEGALEHCEPEDQHAFSELKAALLSAHQAQGEPVAWMAVFETETGVTVDPKEAQLWKHEGYDVEPLYAAPPSSAQTDRVWNEAVEAAEALCDKIAADASKRVGPWNDGRRAGAYNCKHAVRSLKRPLQAQEPCKTVEKEWVSCPICGEPDMRKETDADGNGLIFCVNHECKSNGGNAQQEPSASPAAQSGAVELPPLPKLLLNKIGEYGMARTDKVSELEIQGRWLMLIDGIKEYARDQLSRAQTAPAVSEEEVQRLWDENVSFDPPPRGNYSRELLAFANACAALSAPAPAPVSAQPAAQTAGVLEDLADAVSKALRRAWSLGQTYWQQADSESYSQNKKSDETQTKFEALVDDTRAMLAAAPQPVAEQVGEDIAWSGRTIELKTDSSVYQDVVDGKKPFELRRDDRGYQLGDDLLLRETQYTGAEMKAGAPLIYTDRQTMRRIGYILRGPIYGLADGWVIAAFAAHPQAAQAKESGNE